MFISIDIKCVRNHISILQEEKKEAQSLEEYLIMWRKQADLDGLSDIGFIEKHLRIVRSQISYIHQRITLLESMADEFAGVKNYTAKLLEEAKSDERSFLITL